jgi:hypothetical protein
MVVVFVCFDFLKGEGTRKEMRWMQREKLNHGENRETEAQQQERVESQWRHGKTSMHDDTERERRRKGTRKEQQKTKIGKNKGKREKKRG